jgi:aminopeptidase-like protein
LTGQLIYDFIGSLFKIPRSLTGEGVRQTFSKIKSEYLHDLTIHEIPSEKEVGDWTIPKEWNIYAAYIQNQAGEKIINFEENNLHVVGYSVPINRKIALQELNEHIYSLPELPDAIPYVTSYYRETWGFCMADSQRKNLKDEKYHVYIDSVLSTGSLTYADLIIPGQQKEEIFFSTYICHPSMANNELSGPGLATYLAKWLTSSSNRYTYRFSFAPETIGAVTYISKNLNDLKKVYAAFNLTCVGDNNSLSLMPSRKGNTIADRVARHVLQNQKNSFKEYDFIKDRGSDERQYCSPGVDLPMVSIMRSKYGEYSEYHTSLDNMDFISPDGLELSYQIHIECIQILEKNFYYKSNILGEPFLSKRGKNYTIVGGRENNESRSAQLILNIMTCCDGSTDIIDIADLLNIYAYDLIPILQSLEEDGLIVKVQYLEG